MRRILRDRWFVVVASLIGLTCSNGPVNIFAFGVFLRPVSERLGIGRGTFASAMLVTNWLTAVSGPFLGMLLDRYGARRVMSVGVVLFAISTAAQYYLTASLLVIYLLFATKGICGAGISPTCYAFTVAKWFDRRRGLALGIAMSGVGLGTSIIPPVTAWLIGAYGWRLAYVGLAVVVLVVPGLMVALFIREPGPADLRARPQLAATALRGISLREALKTWRFYGLVVAFLFGVVCLNGTLTQIVAMLMDRGYALPAATRVLAASGLAAIAGRVASGWLVDRLHGPYVAAGFFILPMIGTALFGSGEGGLVPLAGALLCGAALGAEIDLMGFFVSRYFGLKHYGTIFGTTFGLFGGATGVGPFLSGLSHDLYGTYTPAFALYEVMLVVICLVFVTLGEYPFPAQHRIAAETTAEAPA